MVNSTSPAAGEFVPSPVAWFVTSKPPAYASGGQGLVSTADDFLAFARMATRGGETPQGRFLWPDTMKLMASNRLTPAQRQLPVFGMPFFAARGFGLGVSVVMDKKLNATMGAGAAGSFGWPGGFGGWWQADPASDMVLIWLQACVPPPPEGGRMPSRMPGAGTVVQFQQAAYAALSG